MQEGDLDNLTSESLQMIEGCGRSLLDIIDHLLDHTQGVKDRQSKGDHRPATYNRQMRMSSIKGQAAKTRKHRAATSGPENGCDLATLAEEVVDAALWTTPKATAHSSSGARPMAVRTNSNGPLKVIFTVDPANLIKHGWEFLINPGAWRRLVMNLVTNSIKVRISTHQTHLLLPEDAF